MGDKCAEQIYGLLPSEELAPTVEVTVEPAEEAVPEPTRAQLREKTKDEIQVIHVSCEGGVKMQLLLDEVNKILKANKFEIKEDNQLKLWMYGVLNQCLRKKIPAAPGRLRLDELEDQLVGSWLAQPASEGEADAVLPVYEDKIDCAKLSSTVDQMVVALLVGFKPLMQK